MLPEIRVAARILHMMAPSEKPFELSSFHREGNFVQLYNCKKGWHFKFAQFGQASA